MPAVGAVCLTYQLPVWLARVSVAVVVATLPAVRVSVVNVVLNSSVVQALSL